MSDAVVIVGAGHAGVQAAISLREGGWQGRLVLLESDAEHPYQRPPLSKGFLLGSVSEDRLAMRAPHFYDERGIELRRDAAVSAIDRAAARVTFDSKSSLDFGHLILATGARNRVLRVPGADLAGVHYLRTLGEARTLRPHVGPGRRVAVIGAGFIGLEFAAAARHAGAQVTVIDVAERVMARAVSPTTSSVFGDAHAREGTKLLLGTAVRGLLGNGGRVLAVDTAEHGAVDADVVVVGIGVVPNMELAAQAGLAVADGVLVDEQLLTSDPRISAIGDCAAHPNPYAGTTVRIESIQNATDQARCVAGRLLGKPAPYRSVPWFWSDQGALKLQIAGLGNGADRFVLRGDPARGAYSVFSFVGDRLLAVESVNRPGEHLVAKRLLAAELRVDPARVADETVDLKALLSAS